MDTVEKVSALRAHLRLGNSQLVKLAIDELHRFNPSKLRQNPLDRAISVVVEASYAKRFQYRS